MKKQVSISKRNLLLFGLPVLGLLLGLIGNFALVAPQKSQSQRLDTQIQLAQAQLLTAKRAAAKPAKKVAKPKAQPVQAADIFRLSRAMPNTNDMPGILQNLAQLAKESSVTLTSVTPSPIVAMPNDYGALPLAVVVAGKFAQVTKFLHGLRMQARIDRAGHLHVNGRLFDTNQVVMNSPDGLTVSATLKLDAFVYGAGLPPATPAVGATGAAGATTTTTPSGH